MADTTTFTLDLGSVDLSVEEIWPDDDAPDNPTAEDVVKRMRGTASSVVDEWNLLDQIEITGSDGSRAIFR